MTHKKVDHLNVYVDTQNYDDRFATPIYEVVTKNYDDRFRFATPIYEVVIPSLNEGRTVLCQCTSKRMARRIATLVGKHGL